MSAKPRTYAERLQRIGEQARKWVRLEAEKARAAAINRDAFYGLLVLIGPTHEQAPIAKRGRSEDGKPGYFWTEHAPLMHGTGEPNTRADSDPRVRLCIQTWKGYALAKQAAGRARAVVTRACNELEKAARRGEVMP